MGWDIGGVRVAVSSGTARLLPNQLAPYQPFSVAEGELGGSTPDMCLDVFTEAPDLPAGDVMFDCGGAWFANQDELGYRLSLASVGDDPPDLIARSDAATTKVSVHIREEWARQLIEADLEWPKHVPDPFRFPLDRLLLMNHMATRGGITVHSAGLVFRDWGFVFPGVSGAGKTTLCGLLADGGLADGLLSDDRTILRRDDMGGFRMWGTPWPGDAKIARSASAPLRALCFLVQADAAAVVPITPAAAAKRLFAVSSCPWYRSEGVAGVLDTIDRLVTTVPSFEFRFPRDVRATELLRRHAASLDASASPSSHS